MNDRHDELLDLCAGYALGALSDAERGRLERHLDSGCDECERAIAELREGVVILARSAGEVLPAPALGRRVLEAIAAEPPAQTGRVTSEPSARSGAEPRRPGAPAKRRLVPFPVAALGWAAAAAFAVVSVVQVRSVAELGAKLDDLRTAQARLEAQFVEERQWTAAMSSPNAQVAFMSPTPGGSPELAGWALLDAPSRRAIVVLENLRADPGHAYELWAIRADGPRSLGLIPVDAGGRALVRIVGVPDPADLAAFAVSYEAAGGSPSKTAPTGPVVLVGGIKS